MKQKAVENNDAYYNLKSYSRFALICTFVVKLINFCALNDLVF